MHQSGADQRLALHEYHYKRISHRLQEIFTYSGALALAIETARTTAIETARTTARTTAIETARTTARTTAIETARLFLFV